MPLFIVIYWEGTKGYRRTAIRIKRAHLALITIFLIHRKLKDEIAVKIIIIILKKVAKDEEEEEIDWDFTTGKKRHLIPSSRILNGSLF